MENTTVTRGLMIIIMPGEGLTLMLLGWCLKHVQAVFFLQIGHSGGVSSPHSCCSSPGAFYLFVNSDWNQSLV